jgi:hypothetical protein
MIDRGVMQDIMQAYASEAAAHRPQQQQQQQALSPSAKLEKEVQDDMRRSNCARKLIRQSKFPVPLRIRAVARRR